MTDQAVFGGGARWALGYDLWFDNSVSVGLGGVTISDGRVAGDTTGNELVFTAVVDSALR